MFRLVILLLSCSLFCNCEQKGKYYDTSGSDTTEKRPAKKDSAATTKQAVKTPLADNGLELFCNHEMIPYCVWLPLKDFKEDFTRAVATKTRHRFTLRLDSAALTSIELQAFSIDRKNYFNSRLFYERDKRDVEEGGLSIDTSYIIEDKHLYLIKGHLPNYNNMRFIQLNWILEDRIALYINYDEKEEERWKEQLQTIIAKGISLQ